MSLLLKLIFFFAKLSAFSFGGGYVMIPVMLGEIEQKGWANVSDLTGVIGIAGMSPGPVAVNAAVGMGYKIAGMPGVAAAFLGITIPCTVIVILVANFFFRIYKHPVVKAALYGLRPVITGIILYGATGIAVRNGMLFARRNTIIDSGYNFYLNNCHITEVKSLIIALASFLILVKTKIHPIFIIICSGALGILIF